MGDDDPTGRASEPDYHAGYRRLRLLPPGHASTGRLRAMAHRLATAVTDDGVEGEDIYADMVAAVARLHDDDRMAVRRLIRAEVRARRR